MYYDARGVEGVPNHLAVADRSILRSTEFIVFARSKHKNLAMRGLWLLVTSAVTPLALSLTLILLPGNLRIHDNLCFNYLHQSDAQVKDTTAIAYTPVHQTYREEIWQDLQSRYARLYGQAMVTVDDWDQLQNILSGPVVYCRDCHIDCVQRLEAIIKRKGLPSVPLAQPFGLGIEEMRGPMFQLRFPLHASRYKALMRSSPRLDLASLVRESSPSSPYTHGESLALHLLNDYLRLEEETFDDTYCERYIEHIARSPEHALSLRRLIRKRAFFRGEVFSGLLGELAALGCISPNLLANQMNDDEFNFLRPSKKYFIGSDVIRRDWHHKLALFSHQHPRNSTTPHWQNEFTSWRGFQQRLTYLSTNMQRNSSSDKLFILLHGFGGSADQFESLASALSKHLVVSLDMVSLMTDVHLIYFFHRSDSDKVRSLLSVIIR